MATPNMLDVTIKNSKLDCYIDACLSIDRLKIYKPHPSVYNLILEKFNVNKNEVLFISSNSWDIAGAKSFGFNVAWINHFNNKKEFLELQPDIKLKSLIDLATII